jgi:hypothetical protein
MDFEARVWDCYGGDSEVVRGLHFGNRQGNSKKAEGGLKGVNFPLRPPSPRPPSHMIWPDQVREARKMDCSIAHGLADLFEVTSPLLEKRKRRNRNESS